MKSLNLYDLTRTESPHELSKLLMVLSGRAFLKEVSPHEAASLKQFTDAITRELAKGGSAPAGSDASRGREWLSFLDGFYFSYTIEHIGKEFDLLKLSSDGSAILNIELKSEAVPLEKIRRQLSLNRYYLHHISRTIYSFTYVSETNTLYTMNDREFLRECPFSSLAEVLKRPVFQAFISREIDNCFRSSNYLVSPVAEPEAFLMGQYFLTNQQFDFRKQILKELSRPAVPAVARNFPRVFSLLSAAGRPQVPVIAVEGVAGTGKTLLLFDLAMALSRRNRVLLLHAGPLRRGHHILNRRLRKIRILSADVFSVDPENEGPEASSLSGLLSGYSCLCIDEANRMDALSLKTLLLSAQKSDVPVILTYDPRKLLQRRTAALEASEGTLEASEAAMEASEAVIKEAETKHLAFSGKIRINRPIYSFMHSLFCLKDQGAQCDYSCIDVLYASNSRETRLIAGRYLSMGYRQVPASFDVKYGNTIIAQEYRKVLVIMDNSFYYDADGYLQVKDDKESALRLIYEGLSRTREKLCIIIKENEPLFSAVLSIRLSGAKRGT